MTDFPLWLAFAVVFLVGYAACGVRRALKERDRRFRHEAPMTSLFHDSNRPNQTPPVWHVVDGERLD